jgi:predicted membrane channel-forming protein YqfA (hemolysin III family)
VSRSSSAVSKAEALITFEHSLHSISYFSIYCVIVSSIYPLLFDSPPVLIFERSFFALIVPIGIFGFIAQALLTLGLQREKAGRGTLAICTLFSFIRTSR